MCETVWKLLGFDRRDFGRVRLLQEKQQHFCSFEVSFIHIVSWLFICFLILKLALFSGVNNWIFQLKFNDHFSRYPLNFVPQFFSDQQVLDCDRTDMSKGCLGGWPWDAWEYMSKNGIARASVYPYKGVVSLKL
jgi:hypothetical protein